MTHQTKKRVPLTQLCRVLGNAERVQLLLCLERPHSVSDLLEKCSLSQSALSQHLALLRDVGMAAASREGKYIFYTAEAAYVQLARAITTCTA